jgi:beta-lactamase class A
MDENINQGRRGFLNSICGLVAASIGYGLISEDAEAKGQKTQKVAKKQAPKQQNIESIVQDYIKEQRAKGKISSDERVAFYVYDLTAKRRIVNIHGDEAFQAASMIKPLIALAYFHKLDAEKKLPQNKRTLRYDKAAKERLRNMIQYNKGVNRGNIATDWFISQVGGPKEVNRMLKSYRGILRQTNVVEYIHNGQTYQNSSSPHDYSRFLYALINGNLPGAEEIEWAMGLEKRNRIYDNVSNIPDGTEIINKTGSTARLSGDMGVVYAKGKNGKDYPYTFIGIVEKEGRAPDYRFWQRRKGSIIRHVSGSVYQNLKQEYNLR